MHPHERWTLTSYIYGEREELEGSEPRLGPDGACEPCRDITMETETRLLQSWPHGMSDGGQGFQSGHPAQRHLGTSLTSLHDRNSV